MTKTETKSTFEHMPYAEVITDSAERARAFFGAPTDARVEEVGDGSWRVYLDAPMPSPVRGTDPLLRSAPSIVTPMVPLGPADIELLELALGLTGRLKLPAGRGEHVQAVAAKLGKPLGLPEVTRAIADALYAGPCLNVVDGVPCLDRETKRELPASPGTRRGFDGYDPSRLCSSCQPYWHAERLAQLMHARSVWAKREAAEAEQTAARRAGS